MHTVAAFPSYKKATNPVYVRKRNMTNVESAKKYSIIAAICFAVLVVYNTYNAINSYDAINSHYFLSFSDFFKLYYSVILVCVIFIGFTVTLFLKNRLAVTIVSGIYALFHVYYITCMNQRLYHVVEYFSMFVSRGYYDPFLYLLADLLGLLAIVAVVIILIMSLKNESMNSLYNSFCNVSLYISLNFLHF